jgi:hypothetical protein
VYNGHARDVNYNGFVGGGGVAFGSRMTMLHAMATVLCGLIRFIFLDNRAKSEHIRLDKARHASAFMRTMAGYFFGAGFDAIKS